MSSARRYDELAKEVERAKQAGCSVCGTTSGTLLFDRNDDYPDKYPVSYLMHRGLRMKRLKAAIAHSTLFCADCHAKAISWKGSRYRPPQSYEVCAGANCQKKVRDTVNGVGYCQYHATKLRSMQGGSSDD